MIITDIIRILLVIMLIIGIITIPQYEIDIIYL